MTPELAARLRQDVVVLPATIALVFGEQVGFFASLSPGSWPRNAAGAMFFSIFSIHALQVLLFAYWPVRGFMFLVGLFGSQTLEELLAWLRTNVVFWVCVILGTSLLLAISPFAAFVVHICVLTIFLTVRVIGAIKSPVRRASALAPVALLAGFCLGFYVLYGFPIKFFCHGDSELVLRSGERLACVTVGVVGRQKFLVVRGPEATTLVWPADVEPASLRRTFDPVIADDLARLAN